MAGCVALAAAGCHIVAGYDGVGTTFPPDGAAADRSASPALDGADGGDSSCVVGPVTLSSLTQLAGMWFGALAGGVRSDARSRKYATYAGVLQSGAVAQAPAFVAHVNLAVEAIDAELTNHPGGGLGVLLAAQFSNPPDDVWCLAEVTPQRARAYVGRCGADECPTGEQFYGPGLTGDLRRTLLRVEVTVTGTQLQCGVVDLNSGLRSEVTQTYEQLGQRQAASLALISWRSLTRFTELKLCQLQ